MNARVLSIAVASILAMALAGCGAGEQQPAQAPPVAAKGIPVDPATAGSITGTVALEGAPPARRPIILGAATRCGEEHGTQLLTEDVVPGANGTLQNVVVYLKGDFTRYSFPQITTPAVLDQRGCLFVPHVVALMTNQPLHVTNSDPMTHNVNGASNNNPRRNISQPAGAPLIEQTFAAEEVAIPVKCNIHSWMKAYIAVLATPYFQVTGSDGSFEIKNVPPGTYMLVAWHEKYGVAQQDVTIGPSEEKSITLTFHVADSN